MKARPYRLVLGLVLLLNAKFARQASEHDPQAAQVDVHGGAVFEHER